MWPCRPHPFTCDLGHDSPASLTVAGTSMIAPARTGSWSPSWPSDVLMTSRRNAVLSSVAPTLAWATYSHPVSPPRLVARILRGPTGGSVMTTHITSVSILVVSKRQPWRMRPGLRVMEQAPMRA